MASATTTASMPAPMSMPASFQPYAGLRFANAFWDEQDRGTDVLFEKLRKSKQTCEEIKRFYEIRAQIEDDYGERLMKLSQHIVGRAEEGTLSESLSNIPVALETVARAHIELGQKLKLHLEAPLDGFLREQREDRRTQQQQIENARQLKNLHQANAARTREFYLAECSKVDKLERYINDHRSELSKEKLKELQKEIADCMKMVTAAELEHRRAIDVYNTVLDDWIRTWRRACNVVQDMEEKRLHYIRNSLWAFANTMTYAYEVDCQFCERIRTALEITDIPSDLDSFVRRYSTGTDPAKHLHFEPYAFVGRDTEQPTPASSVHHGIQPKGNTNSYPVANTITNQDEELKSVETQLQSIQRASKEEGNRRESQTRSEHERHSLNLQQHSPQTKETAIDGERLLASVEPTQDDTTENYKTARPTPAPQQQQPSHPIVSPPIATASLPSPVDMGETLNQALLAQPAPEKTRSEQPSSLKDQDTKYRPVPNPTFIPNTEIDTSVRNVANEPSTQRLETPVPGGADVPHTTDVKSVSDNSSTHDEIRPPPKDEKWVISSFRKPGQVPIIRTQNARRYDGGSSAPLETTHAGMHTPQPGELASGPPEPSPPAVSTGGKTHRNNPPLKIEIPGKRKESAQPLAAPAPPMARAHSQHTSWQPGRPLQNQPMAGMPAMASNAMPWMENQTQGYYDTRTPAVSATALPSQLRRHEDSPDAKDASSKISLGNAPVSVGKKHKDIGSFVKEVLRGASSDAHAEKHRPSDREKPAKEKGNRFSRALFGSKKEKQHSNKDEVYETHEFRSNSSSLADLPPPSSPHRVGVSLQDPPVPRPLSVNPPTLLPLNPQEDQRQMLSDGTPILEFARASWDFKATIPSEMSFDANDIVAVIKKQPDGWWLAELLRTQQRGLVPGNYMVHVNSPFSHS